jgi:anti-anti-sigma factor
MDASSCSLRVHQAGPCVTVQLCGRATMNQALTLRRFGEACISQGTRELRLDLRRCTYLDSTMCGTLLCLKRSMDQRGGGAFTLASPSPECGRLLRQLGLEGLFPVVETDEPAEDWSPIPVEPESRAALKHQIVECHEALAGTGGPGSEQFRTAADCLSKDP